MKKIAFLLIAISLISCKSAPKEKKVNQPTLPERIQKLQIPSGFDNAYVSTILSGKSVQFNKPLIRIASFTVPNSFKKRINEAEYSYDHVLKSELSALGRYTLLGSDEEIKAAIAEQNKIGFDEFNDDGAVEMGMLKIAGYVLTGSIAESYPIVTQMGGHFSLKVNVAASISITDVNTGVIVLSKTINTVNEELLFVSAEGVIIKGPRNLTDKPLNSLNSSGSDIDLGPQFRAALKQSVNDCIIFIEEQFPLMGEVIQADAKSVNTTVSSELGIAEGDYIFIVRVGAPLKDRSGKILGFNKEVIGAAQIQSVESSMSQAAIITLKDPNILPQNGDFIISMPGN